MQTLIRGYILFAAWFSFSLFFCDSCQFALYLSNLRLYWLFPLLFVFIYKIYRGVLSRWCILAALGLLAFPWYLFLTPDYCSSNSAFVPRPSIRILSFNLAGRFRVIDRDLHRILLDNRIDIVALQEVSPGFWRGAGQRLQKIYPYLFYHSDPEGYWTQALLSKFPIVEKRRHDPGAGFTRSGSRLVLDARIIKKDLDFNLLVVHLSIPFTRDQSCRGNACLFFRYNQKKRDAQLMRLHGLINKQVRPVIIAGDLNLSDQNPIYQKFTSSILDGGRCSLNHNLTWPADGTFPWPFLRLDYILLWPGAIKSETDWQTRSRTLQIPGSDHSAVMTDINWKAGLM